MTVPESALRFARERFRALLLGSTPEPEWQRFFAECPYVLTSALPLRLSSRSLVPLARPGRSEPDFVFYQKTGGEVTAFGVIELKRPDQRILTRPRRNIVCLTREAQTAVHQARHYAGAIHLPTSAVFLGSERYCFVVMGLTAELTAALASAIIHPQLRELVPPGVTILPYDEVLRRFEAGLPQRTLLLVPDFDDLGPAQEDDTGDTWWLRITDAQYGDYNSFIAALATDLPYFSQETHVGPPGYVDVELFLSRPVHPLTIKRVAERLGVTLPVPARDSRKYPD